AAKSYEKAIELEPDLSQDEFYEEIKKLAPKQKFKLVKVEENEDDYTEVYEETSNKKITFKAVGVMEKVRESISINIIMPLKNPMFFKAYGKTAGGGIILYGPPGC
ncbi:MAG: hypothetical protein PHX70_09050, partial [Clostridium sp.]|nr:hypothetical protein [Clostridium sp.]